jgi:hypothetical protein
MRLEDFDDEDRIIQDRFKTEKLEWIRTNDSWAILKLWPSS